MSNLGPPPQHLIDAIKQGKPIDGRDPWVRKMMKEEREKEKIRRHEKQQRILESGIRILEEEYKEFLHQETFNSNTVNWNYPKKCKWCDCESMRIIVRPDIMHYAEYYCNVCHKYNDWLPYSEQ